MESKILVCGIIVLLLGVCLGVPLGQTSTTTVGINHWTHDDEDGFLYPTNETDDVSINNNSLLWANLSEYTSNEIYIDNDVFVINSSALGNIFDQDLNTSDSPTFAGLTLNGNLNMATNDISNVNDIEVENDIQLNDKLEHLGDTDTYLDFNANQILFFAGGTEILDMITTLATFGVDLDLDNNALLNANFTEYTSSDIFIDDDKWYVNDTVGLWTESINTLFPATDGRNIQGNGTLDVVHTATEMNDHALEVVVDAGGFGDVKALDIDYVTGAIATGQDEGIILVNIDDIISTGGDIFALEVLATEGGAGIYGLKAGVGVGPIHHDSGIFANPTTGTDNTPSTDVPAMIDGDIETTTAIFENDNEYIIIGAAVAFEEMEFIMKTNSSNPGIKPTFWYSTVGAGQFTQFTPVDGTNGFRNTGVVAWDASDLTGHTTNDDTGTYDIKVIRTQNNLVTTPVLGYAKGASTTEYIWDENGDLIVNSVNATYLIANNATFNYVDKLESTAPATPPADTLRLYVEEIQNFSFYKYLDDTGMKRQLVRDSMILVKNVRGTTIAANRIVYVTGSENNVPTVDLAKADSIDTMPAIGVTIESIADRSFGRVIQVGLLENVNTDSLEPGDVLYVSDVTAGVPVTVPPVTPSLTQEIGACLVKSATVGSIQIIARALTGNEFGTINDFNIRFDAIVEQELYANKSIHCNGTINATGDANINGNVNTTAMFVHNADDWTELILNTGGSNTGVRIEQWGKKTTDGSNAVFRFFNFDDEVARVQCNRIDADNKGELRFYTSDGLLYQRVTIKSDGDVGIKDATPDNGSQLDVNGKIECAQLVETSDYRIKNNFTDVDNATILKLCRNLRLYLYNYNDFITGDGNTSNGWINFSCNPNTFGYSPVAQEVYIQLNNSFGVDIANSVVRKGSINELWTINNNVVQYIFARGWQINDARVSNMENFLMGYGYDPDEDY